MATRNHPPSSPPADAQPAAQSDADPVVPPPRAQRSRLAIAGSVFAIWFALLSTLAVWTANPVTINRQQVHDADIVVEAAVTDADTGNCRIIRTWPTGNIGESITVCGLSDLAVVAGESYLVPLMRTDRGGGFDVVPTHLPGSPRFIYPATDESRQQLEDVLGQQ